jgi:hypothetical protein
LRQRLFRHSEVLDATRRASKGDGCTALPASFEGRFDLDFAPVIQNPTSATPIERALAKLVVPSESTAA